MISFYYLCYDIFNLEKKNTVYKTMFFNVLFTVEHKSTGHLRDRDLLK